MQCEPDYFFDGTTGGCLSCRESCDPARPPTLVECQTKCRGYLQRTETTQNSVASLDSSHPNGPDKNTMLVVVSVVSISLVSAVTIICIFTLCRWHRIGKGRGHGSTKDSMEIEHVSIESKQHLSSSVSPTSLCQYPSYSDTLPSHGRSTLDFSITPNEICASQETQQIRDYTQLKEMNSYDSVDLQVEHKAIGEIESIDLKEDIDLIEEALEPRQRQEVALLQGSFSCSDNRSPHFRIVAVLQKLPWVRQFWWEADGAKVAVDAAHQHNGKEEIRRILQREGIRSQEFCFDLVRSL